MIQRIRDLLKGAVLMRRGDICFLILGLENQSGINYAMPVRNMVYNGLRYSAQVDVIAKQNIEQGKAAEDEFLSGFTKNDRLIPVITITLYWGSEPWDAPVTLKEMYAKHDPALDPYLDDCNINLFSIIDCKEMPKFNTKMGDLFALLNARNDPEALQMLAETNENIKHFDRLSAELVSTFTNLDMPRKNREGEYNMCKAVEGIKEMAYKAGEAKGEANATARFAEKEARYQQNEARYQQNEALYLQRIAALEAQLAIARAH